MATTVKRVGVVGLEQLDRNLATADLVNEATSTAPMYPAFVNRRLGYQEPAR